MQCRKAVIVGFPSFPFAKYVGREVWVSATGPVTIRTQPLRADGTLNLCSSLETAISYATPYKLYKDDTRTMYMPKMYLTLLPPLSRNMAEIGPLLWEEWVNA